MSTRSRVGMVTGRNEVKSIYVHFDGYPSHHIPILTEFYNSKESVEALLDLGDLSVLAERIGEKQDFDDRATKNPEWCLAYGRDRGEDGIEAQVHRENAWPDSGQEYEYLFDPFQNGGTWLYREQPFWKDAESWVEETSAVL